MERVTLCYCSNRNMYMPLCVSMYTALLHLAPECHLDIHVLHNDFSEAEELGMKRCLDRTGRDYSLNVRRISLNRFSRVDSLHGDRMVWARLLLPELLSDRDKVLYIDADTVILTDLSKLARQSLGEAALGAVANGTMRYMLENQFFNRIGLDLDAPCFNSGVLLFNVDPWLQKDCTDSVVSFAETHRGECKSADQTALNATFHKKFFHLPKKFNRRAYPTGKLTEDEAEDSVLHFVGSPKPWDLFGSLIHDNHEYFDRHTDRAGVENSFWHKLRWKNLKRTIQIARSYYGHAKKKWERSR